MLIIIFACKIQFLKMNKYNKYRKIWKENQKINQLITKNKTHNV